MMHSILSTLLLLPALALSAPVDSCPKPHTTTAKGYPHPTSTHHTPTPTPTASNTPFTLMSVRSASPIHYGQINAAGQAFWINKQTATYCPSGVSGLDCSGFQNDTTVLITGALNTATSGAALYDTVPGGQQVYVAKDGALGFTQAHSASVPEGAYLTGFVHTPPANGQPYGFLSFEAGGATGLVACNQGATDAGPYKIHANVKGKDFSKCLGFDAFAVTYDGKTAWQYT